ncbi:hypothetical protein BKA56DRAFT_242864 [Ilyonectria sp. MPI-CAGE-AT-0026]|nr:hypothetical protein BKA56DRAFT_242864 [Ilyonectria sp. MPI-CAGE-AT-0026]
MLPQPITDPYNYGNQFARNFDYLGQEFRVCWSGDWRKPPNLADFPHVENATVTPISHTPNVDALWRTSHAIAHGSNAHLRLLKDCTDNFPICKIASNDQQKSLIYDEFCILQKLLRSYPEAPVVQICQEPLEDDDGIFGYRMEELSRINFNEFPGYYGEIQNAVQIMHKTGVIHNDLSISNIMLNAQHRITLIDFGRAGYVGERIPVEKERAMRPLGKCIYSRSLDHQALLELHSLIQH